MTIKQAVQYGIKRLSALGNDNSLEADFIPSPSPALDINCILENILQKSRTFLLVHCDTCLSPEEQSKFEDAITKRRKGLPVAYITNHKEFYGLDFYVTPAVLIPKPDTELLVEHAIASASKVLATAKDSFKIADVCTGSGCIAISVLHEILANDKIPEGNKKSVITIASDISADALSIAQKNAQHLIPENSAVQFVQGDLLEPFPDTMTFDMILSNPPYIPSKEVTELLKDGRSEPRLALDGDTDSAITSQNAKSSQDGLAIIRRLIPQAFQKLSIGGIFFIETGEYNAKKTACLMEKTGFTNVKTFTDLAGQLRLTQGIKA